MSTGYNEDKPLEAAGFLSGGGEMGLRMRALDWSKTRLGPVDEWPQSLRTALGILLNSGYPMYIAWGPEFIQFFNDAYRPILGESKHPALGQSTPDTFAEIRDFIGPMFRRALAGGEATTLVAYDIPFSLLYVVDENEKQARLAGTSSIEPEIESALRVVNLSAAEAYGWPLAEVARTGRATAVEDLQQRFGQLPAGAWPERPQTAMVLPVTVPDHTRPELLIVLAVSARKALNAEYRNFFEQVAAQIGLTLAGAQAYAAERRRAEALAELDRAKTAFFSNVSHEFRTPLTLMLGPLEDALSRRLDPDERRELETVHRNGLRLLRLVNTLLDFSRIEAGRV